MKVFEFVPEGTQDCIVTAWLHTNHDFEEMKDYSYDRPAIIICPGGGYCMLSERETEPAAKPFFVAGYHTFILRYAVGADEAKGFKPLIQLASTVAHIRKYAKEWHVQSNKIAVSGFSAGGHLACSLGTLYNEEKFLNVFGRDVNVRPDAMVLVYPVIVANEFAHEDSIRKVSGAEPGTDDYKWFSLNTHVDSETPPTFLYHTSEDEVVPAQNSIQMANALAGANVPFELHILPEGHHGMSVCNREINSYHPYNARWVNWAIAWLNRTFEFEV